MGRYAPGRAGRDWQRKGKGGKPYHDLDGPIAVDLPRNVIRPTATLAGGEAALAVRLEAPDGPRVGGVLEGLGDGGEGLESARVSRSSGVDLGECVSEAYSADIVIYSDWMVTGLSSRSDGRDVAQVLICGGLFVGFVAYEGASAARCAMGSV